MFSFAGHGIERGGQAFLLSSDAKVSNDIRVVQETAVGANHVKQWIRDMGIKQVLMLLDGAATTRWRAGRKLPIPWRKTSAKRSRSTCRTTMWRRLPRSMPRGWRTGVPQFGKGPRIFHVGAPGRAPWGGCNAAGEVTLGAWQRYVQDTVPRLVHVELGPTVDQRPFAEVGGYRAEELVLARGAAKGGPAEAAAANARARELEQWERIGNSRDIQAFASFRQK